MTGLAISSAAGSPWASLRCATANITAMPLTYPRRGDFAARQRRVGGDPRDVVYGQRRPVKHRILPVAARAARRPRCMRHPRCARSCDATSGSGGYRFGADRVGSVHRGIGRAAAASAGGPAAGSGRTRSHHESRPLGYSHGKVVLYTMTSIFATDNCRRLNKRLMRRARRGRQHDRQQVLEQAGWTYTRPFR